MIIKLFLLNQAIARIINSFDSSFQTMMDNFPIIFHEPYFRDYTTDNLSDRLEKAGFVDIAIQNHFASKYWVARKPTN